MEFTEKQIVALAVGVLVLVLLFAAAVYGGVGYVIWHFVAKYW